MDERSVQRCSPEPRRVLSMLLESQSGLGEVWPALEAEGLAPAVQLHTGAAVREGVIREPAYREPAILAHLCGSALYGSPSQVEA